METNTMEHLLSELKHHVICYIQKQDYIVITAVLGKHISPAKHFSQPS